MTEEEINVYREEIDGTIAEMDTTTTDGVRGALIDAKAWFITRDSEWASMPGAMECEDWKPLCRDNGLEYVFSAETVYKKLCSIYAPAIPAEEREGMLGLDIRVDTNIKGLTKPYVVCRKKDSATNWEWPVKETK